MNANRNFTFPWPILRVVAEGASILDVPKLELKSMEEATTFVRAYGFDPNDKTDIDLLWAFFEDAVSFIDKSLKDPNFSRVPEHLRSRHSVVDIRRLLLLASNTENHSDQVWVCAILRLMHVFIHLAHDPRIKFFDQVRTQVLARLDSHITIDPTSGTTYLGTRDDGIKLLFFKKKDRKDREREIIKLLHKADSLVEEIYDRVGFRLVTETKYDAMRAVRLLMEKNIISIPNVRPGRSRNRLVDLGRFQSEITRIEQYLSSRPQATDADLNKLLRRLERRIGQRQLGRSFMNPHSSEYYHAIQFTCRELVKVRNSSHRIYSQLAVFLEGMPGGLQMLNDLFSKPPAEFEPIFFPYEIQIMDVRSYADSIFGKSNHEEYKKKQLETARNRVFGRMGP
jgi:uncharacterized protein (TIGR04562 family)